MTVGFWQQEAHRFLRATAEAMHGSRAGPAAEVYAVISARSDVYRQLVRVTELLAGGRPVPEVPSRVVATTILTRQEPSLTRLYVGLQAATILDQPYPPAPRTTGLAGRAMGRAADSIGVIGDIIAGHVPPGLRPRSPEGAAIRAGGGVPAALGDIAQLATDAVAVDTELVAWLAGAEGPAAETYQTILDAARWTINSRLGTAAADVAAESHGQPNLLRELDLVRSPRDSVTAVTTIQEATDAIAAVRTWLWRSPNQVTAVHLQATTQLGLAVQLLCDDRDTPYLRRWRQAAIAAAELRGAPPIALAASAASELIEALRWTRSRLNPRDGEPIHEHVGHLAEIDRQVRSLAATMQRGLHSAVQRHDLFVADTVLRRPTGSIIYRATQQWRPATYNDDQVRHVSRALRHRPQRVESTRPNQVKPTASQAFPHQFRVVAPAPNRILELPTHQVPDSTRTRSR